MRLAPVGRVLGALLVVAACANTNPSPLPPASNPPTLQPLGGTLRVGMDLVTHANDQVSEDGTWNSIWDPQMTWSDEPFELFRCCLLRTLMSYNGRSTSEGGAEVQPDLAADVPTISADGLTWTFRLKSGLHYAPPYATTAIVSADIVRALERSLRPDPFREPGEVSAFSPYAFEFADVIAGAKEFSEGTANSISGLETPDDVTLVVHLISQVGDLGTRLALPAAAPIPAGAADGHDAGYGRYLVASGPYMIEGSDMLDPSLPPAQQPVVSGYVPGVSLTLVRNPSWERDTDSLRSAIVDRIEISQIADYDAELTALLDDQLDVSLSTSLEAEDVNRLRVDGQIAPLIHSTPALKTRWITMNLAVPPFDDVHVRRAVSLATNKRAIMSLLEPSALLQTHAIPDAFENGLLTGYDPFGTPDSGGSIDRAKTEMALSRYDANADGVCDDLVCAQLQLGVRNDDPAYSVALQEFAGTLAQIGLGLEMNPVSVDELFGAANDPTTHTPMVFTTGWQADYFNASSWFVPLAMGSLIGQDGGFNLSLIGASPDQLRSWGYTVADVPGIDNKIASCVSLSGAAQFNCWAEVDQYLTERIVAWIPLANQQTSRLTSVSVTNFEFDASLTMPAFDQISVALDR